LRDFYKEEDFNGYSSEICEQNLCEKFETHLTRSWSSSFGEIMQHGNAWGSKLLMSA
jgi:hypothetical protein